MIPQCDVCGALISDDLADFSFRMFGEHLCMNDLMHLQRNGRTHRSMKQLGNGLWEVESDSSPDRIYVVQVIEDIPLNCTCPAFAIKRNKAVKDQSIFISCKHIESVIRQHGFATDPTAGKAAKDAAVADLRKMQEDLNEITKQH